MKGIGKSVRSVMLGILCGYFAVNTYSCATFPSEEEMHKRADKIEQQAEARNTVREMIYDVIKQVDSKPSYETTHHRSEEMIAGVWFKDVDILEKGYVVNGDTLKVYRVKGSLLERQTLTFALDTGLIEFFTCANQEPPFSELEYVLAGKKGRIKLSETTGSYYSIFITKLSECWRRTKF